MEISLPDEAGRVQILSIHTNKMRTNGSELDKYDPLLLTTTDMS